jgi:hypothetical protein
MSSCVSYQNVKTSLVLVQRQAIQFCMRVSNMSNDGYCQSCEGTIQKDTFVGIAHIVQAVTPMMHQTSGDSAYSDI